MGQFQLNNLYLEREHIFWEITHVGEPDGGVVGDGLLPDFKQLLSLLGWL
jgi:hypothetical protein